MPKLAVVSIVVADMAASVDFYARLGLTVLGDASDDHTTFTGDGLQVMLDSEELIANLDPTWTRPSGGHAMALAFLCDTPAQVDEQFGVLVQQGAPVKQEPWDAFWGQRYASVLDPDGNQIDLYASL